MILSIKFSFHKDKINELIRLIEISHKINKLNLTQFDLITNVPMSSKKQNIRGFNQTEIIAKALGEKYNIKYLQILEKVKNTKAQIDLSREERLINLQSTFKFKNLKDNLENKKILIIDDICTTGSTLSECADTIINYNSSIQLFGLCLARGES